MDGLDNGLIVLCGSNGAGKTNILEAVSLLSPGRGLRGARAQDIQKVDSQTPWGISGVAQVGGLGITLGTGITTETERRIVKINGVLAKSQNALSDYISCLWLTPQMDRLFLEGAAGRRRFLDRMIFSFDAGHSGRVTRYENAMRQRAKLLQDESSEIPWIDSLEAQMAETGIAITAARLDFVDRLSASFIEDERVTHYFPKADLLLDGKLSKDLRAIPSLKAEENFSQLLRQSRRYDAVAGGAQDGPHKQDLKVHYIDKNMPAAQCSTGEQKALLISIILAHGRMMQAERGAPSIFLLDEIAAHLDEDRRAALFDQLVKLGGQVWMTGTDPLLFNSIENTAQFFTIDSGHIKLKVF